jgi:short-subunit dehydrogenase
MIYIGPQMTKLLLPKVLEKKNGLIVNISSSSSILTPPMLMCYGASKVRPCHVGSS